VPYDLGGLARLTQIALALQAAVSLLAAANGMRGPVAAEDLASGLVALAQVLVFLFAAVCFLLWTYRAKSNGRATGAKGLSFSPAMATWGYFIPLANLVVPAQAMQELYKSATQPRDWEAVGGSGTIWLWWFFWIAGNIAGIVSFRLLTMEDAPEAAAFAGTLGIVSDLGTACASLALIRVVGTISARLQRLRDTVQFV
jgi:heme/copper-type cytochrome/quinol oxidase subunit 2